jgi:hypothetical protein
MYITPNQKPTKGRHRKTFILLSIYPYNQATLQSATKLTGDSIGIINAPTTHLFSALPSGGPQVSTYVWILRKPAKNLLISV